MQVHVTRADITTLSIDAIVNPSNSMGIMGGGVAAAIRSAGGDSIQAEAMQRAPIAIGAAVITAAGTLPCKHVIHAPLMEEPGQSIVAENVRRAARAALLAANHSQLQVIAIPGMGTLLGGVPRAESARAIIEELRAHKKPYPETVYLVDIDAEMIAAFEQAMSLAQYS